MFSNLFRWIRANLNITAAVVGGLLVLASAFIKPQWWGDRAWGVLIGVAATIVTVAIIVPMLERTSFDEDRFIPWILLIVPTATALIVRRFSGQSLRLPIQFSPPGLPAPQSLLLGLFAIVLLILLWAFGSAIRNGDGVAIENHWGGLGGGIGGWRLSAPLIYLLGIVFMLGVSVTIAWRLFPAPKEAASSSTPPPSPSPTAAETPSPSPSASPVVRPSPSASQPH